MPTKEFTRKYIREHMPPRPFRKRFVIRDRKPYEIFFQEIVIALFIMFMLFMLFANYMSNQAYARQNITKTEQSVGVGVSINEHSNLAQKSPVRLNHPPMNCNF